MKFLSWLLSLFIAFSLGAESTRKPTESEEELRAKVQGHIDVIVDESAAIVDDVVEAARQDEGVQAAEKFVQDVKEVAEETVRDLNAVYENAAERVEEKFGTKKTEGEKESESVKEETPAEEAKPAEEEKPAEEKEAEEQPAEAENAEGQEAPAAEEPTPELPETPAPEGQEKPASGDPVNG